MWYVMGTNKIKQVKDKFNHISKGRGTWGRERWRRRREGCLSGNDRDLCAPHSEMVLISNGRLRSGDDRYRCRYVWRHWRTEYCGKRGIPNVWVFDVWAWKDPLPSSFRIGSRGWKKVPVFKRLANSLLYPHSYEKRPLLYRSSYSLYLFVTFKPRTYRFQKASIQVFALAHSAIL